MEVRLDKWLWAVRVYKTRSLAAEACRAGKVEIATQKAKPARIVRVDEVINAKVGLITRTVRVLALTEHRLGAEAAKAFAEDLTPDSEYAKLKEASLQSIFSLPRGLGRPTKKNRRSIEQFFAQQQQPPPS